MVATVVISKKPLIMLSLLVLNLMLNILTSEFKVNVNSTPLTLLSNLHLLSQWNLVILNKWHLLWLNNLFLSALIVLVEYSNTIPVVLSKEDVVLVLITVCSLSATLMMLILLRTHGVRLGVKMVIFVLLSTTKMDQVSVVFLKFLLIQLSKTNRFQFLNQFELLQFDSGFIYI